MECPWEKAVKVISNRGHYTPQQTVAYLLVLEGELQHCVNDAPNIPVQFLPKEPPPAMVHEGAAFSRPEHVHNRNQNGQNRFQMYEEDEEEVEVGNTTRQPNRPRRRGRPQGSSTYSAEDIYIQVITTLGEMLGLVALDHGKNSRWAEGANSFSESFKLLNIALTMSDAMYAHITARQELGDIELAQVVERVRNKCHGISIAASHSLEQKEHFVHVALRRKDKLKNNLEPQWQDRDAARAKMGEAAWNNNPRPKKDYAALREKDEAELRALDKAMDALTMVDYEMVRLSADQRIRTL